MLAIIAIIYILVLTILHLSQSFSQARWSRDIELWPILVATIIILISNGLVVYLLSKQL